MTATRENAIRVLLADDNVIVREGVRALLARTADVNVVATADDLPTLVAAAIEHEPDVVVSDIRMPPNFQSEGIDGCKEIRKRLPGTGIVILSQFDDPDYAIAHFNLAAMYLEQKPPAKALARRHYDKALSLGAEKDEVLERKLAAQ